MCESVGATREHSPPRCLFPESKDLEDGADLRKNLITVPSCADHNPKLSKDDEYFLVIAVSNWEGNARQGEQSNKVVRALRRSPAFMSTAFAGAQPTTVDGKPTMSFTVDRVRVERVIEKTARGVYFHHTGGQKLLAPLKIVLPMLRYRDGSIQDGVSELGSRLQAWQSPWLGDNPEVFCYRIHLYSGDRGFVQMSFYQGFGALVVWGRPDAELAG
jgi:hypothetical protein